MYKNTSKMKEFLISSIFSCVNVYAFVHSVCLLLVQLFKFGKVQTVDGFYYSLKCKEILTWYGIWWCCCIWNQCPHNSNIHIIHMGIQKGIDISLICNLFCYMQVSSAYCNKKKSYTYNKYFELSLKKYVLCIFS